MKNALLEAVDQAGVPISEVVRKDVRRRRRWDGRDASEWEHEFILEALKFKELLDEMLLDPVIRIQIEDHLAFTRAVWPYHYGTSISGGEVMMVNYYKISEAAKDIALSEYVAINYLLSH